MRIGVFVLRISSLREPSGVMVFVLEKLTLPGAPKYGVFVALNNSQRN